MPAPSTPSSTPSCTATGVAAIGIAIRLNGSSRWYANDFGSGYPLYSGGHGRTAVKLPLDWLTKGIAAVRLVADRAAHGHAKVAAVQIGILGLTSQFAVVRPSFPTPTVTVR